MDTYLDAMRMIIRLKVHQQPWWGDLLAGIGHKLDQAARDWKSARLTLLAGGRIELGAQGFLRPHSWPEKRDPIACDARKAVTQAAGARCVMRSQWP